MSATLDVTSTVELVPAPRRPQSPLSVVPASAGEPSTRRDWRRAYVRRLVGGDLACSAIAAAVGLSVKFGLPASAAVQPAAEMVAASLPLVWPLVMLLAGAYDRRFLFIGADEFVRVFWAATMLLAAVGTVSWALKLEVARGFVVVALPLVMVLTVLCRFVHRRWLRLCRSQGRFTQNVVLVGQADGLASLHRRIDRMAYLGYRVSGCCVPNVDDLEEVRALGVMPVLGLVSDTAEIVRRHGVDAVVALPSGDLGGDELRRLGWALEGTDADLVLVPAMTEVAAPRVRLRPEFGLASLHVDR